MLMSLKGKIRSGYVLAFLLLLTSYFLIFYTMRNLNRESDMVTHGLIIVNKLEALKGEITEAETGVRGYVITHDVRFLNPFHSASKNVPLLSNELRELMKESDDPLQVRRLDTLQLLLTRRLDFLSQGVIRFQTAGFQLTPEQMVKSDLSRRQMDSIRLFVTKLKKAEEQLGSKRQFALSRFFSGTQIITIISLVTAVLAIVYSVYTYNNEKKAKESADEKVDLYRQELESNINELKSMNNELQELRNMEKFVATGRIARTIAHEVRNPLTNIFLASEQLHEIKASHGESSILLDMINRNAGRINQLVSDLLNATKFVHLEFRIINVNQLMEETLEMAIDRIELNNIRVEKYYLDETCNVAVDKEKMKLALLNIIVNAIEAMEKNNGILQLKTRRQGNKCLIEIKDNGTGMNEDALQKLFEPYFTSKPKGNGLGLTNTQSIVLSHKGAIKVYSKPGQGTLFVIILSAAGENGEEEF